MARPQASGIDARAELRSQSRGKARRLRRLLLAALALAIIGPILVIAFDSASTSGPVPVPRADRLLPGGPPTPQVVAYEGSLRIYLPIPEDRVTAVGYHGVGQGALPLNPVGTQANAGLFTRIYRRLFDRNQGGIRYNLIGGGSGPETAGLDIGAPVGTVAYSPVDGTVIGIAQTIVAGKPFGATIDIQPSGSPGLVVSVSNLEPDVGLTVGSAVAAARTPLGAVIDLSSVETPALARYTQDTGQHVHIEVRPTASLPIP